MVLLSLVAGLVTGGVAIGVLLAKKIKSLQSALAKHVSERSAIGEQHETNLRELRDRNEHLQSNLSTIQSAHEALKSKYDILYKNNIQVINDRNRLKALVDKQSG